MKIRETFHQHHCSFESEIFDGSSILNFNAENINGVDARQKALKNSSLLMKELFPKRIIKGLVKVLQQKRVKERNFRTVKNYSMPNVSEKGMNIILNEVDYMNKAVWS